VAVLEINDLSIDFVPTGGTKSTNIVNALNFSVPEGTIFGLAGESGCGKSLTALSVMGLLPQGMLPKGSIQFKGNEVVGMSEDKLRSLRGSQVSMIFQEPMTSLNPVLRIGYQLEEVINTHLNVTKKEARRIALGLLRSVHIPSPEIRMREYPHQMSGGMRQRVMIAMAIACSPALLIADEPTTALDVTIEAQILDLLGELSAQKNMAVLLITHDLGIIAENASHVAIMYAGRIVETAPVADLYDRPRHPYTMGLLDSLPHGRGEPLKPIPGYVPKPAQLPEGCKFSDRCSFVIPACRTEEPGLDALEEGSLHSVRCIRAKELTWK
jgi:oligopeptide/dipeptide ABC transporter ATP-binding protein